MENENKVTKRKHDAYFRWLFADTTHARYLLELAGKINHEIDAFLTQINLDTLMRIPDSYSEVDDTGEADLAFRVNVSTGAPILVGILLEHKSGRDPVIFDQISKYIHSVMKIQDKNRIFSGIPTMAVIFYNGRDNWNPLKILEKSYPDYFRGKVLPFQCTFVNMADIPDSDCLACENTATGMGIIALKHAFNKDKLLELLPQFCKFLDKMPRNEASCLLEKTSIYLVEYLGKDFLKELNMAFVSIGQKYGFVSIGDYFRQQMAEERQQMTEERLQMTEERLQMAEERQQITEERLQMTEERQQFEEKLADERDKLKKAEEEKLRTAQELYKDNVPMEILVRRFNLTEEQIRGK